MIRLTLEFTDNLGPEADVPALLHKLDARLRDAPIGDVHVLAAARLLTDYVATVEEGARATVILTLRAPSDLEDPVRDCAESLFDLVETHLTEIYLRRAVVISLQLDITAGGFPDRRHEKAANVSF
jgi:5-carboxymethyl-2-hydroxymuconate isomerase